MFIPDPDFYDFYPSRISDPAVTIATKEEGKKLSKIWMGLGSRDQKGTGSRIQIRNTGDGRS
jgi:hypothetical protein